MDTNQQLYAIFPPKKINAAIELPASKSISNRALIINALNGNNTDIRNLSECDDTVVLKQALENMPETIDIHASGTAMRFMTAFLAQTSGTHIITGTQRMCQRPIAPLVSALRQLGAKISYIEQEGFPPLKIEGQPLHGGIIEIDGNISSQFITALLLIAPTLDTGIDLRIRGNITSRPYIDLTVDVMQAFGADISWDSANRIIVKPKPYSPPATYSVESDWSAASYWYEIIALMSDNENEVELCGLTDGSRQGDSAVRYLFSMLGVKTTFSADNAPTPSARLKMHFRTLPRLDYDFTNQPDIAQTLVVVCCMANIPFRFTGLSTLKIKETDRLQALQREMLKLGYIINEIDGETLEWNGERCDADEIVTIETYNDHRMAMPLAAAAVKKEGIRIMNPMVVEKSYPRFWDDLRRAGFTIEEINE